MEIALAIGIFSGLIVSGSLYYYSVASLPEEVELLPLAAPADMAPQLFLNPEASLDDD